MKNAFLYQRYVWSSECGGCIMLQKRKKGSLEWVDSDSREEGQYPTYTKAVKEIVKWYNLQLRVESIDQKAYDLQKQLNALASAKGSLQRKQMEHSARSRKLQEQGK